MSERWLLDVSSILAYLFEEKGAARVEQILEYGQGVVSSVNCAEVVSKLIDRGMPIEAARISAKNLELECISFDRNQAYIAAELRLMGKSLGLSLADRACLACAIILNLPILTADSVWKELNSLSCQIELLR